MRYHREFHLNQGVANPLEDAYKSGESTFVIADLGCGKGLYHEDMKQKLDGLGERDIEIIGFDINEEALEHTYENDTAQADLKKYIIPLQNNSVDFVYSNHLRCKLDKEDLEEIEKDAERVLKDEGKQIHRC